MTFAGLTGTVWQLVTASSSVSLPPLLDNKFKLEHPLIIWQSLLKAFSEDNGSFCLQI